MENNLLISVIIPVYKVEPYIRQCVESVLAQTYRNLEIILVDDGSPDRCPEICDEYAQLDNRIVVIHQSNQGQSGARNTGLDRCTGDVVAFVDSDDWIEPDMYEQMIRMMQDKNLDAVFCGADRIDNGVVREKLGRYFEDGAVVEAKEVLSLCLQSRITAHCWNRLCRRRCLEKVRFPVGKVYEDIWVSHLPFYYAKRPVGFLHAPLYNYRHNQQSITVKSGIRESYHVFWGRVELLRFARENMPEEADRCMERAAHMGLFACSRYAACGSGAETEDVSDIVCFFRENMTQLLRCRSLKPDRKILLLLCVYMKKVYFGLYHFLKKE